jgi:hypothetical protein
MAEAVVAEVGPAGRIVRLEFARAVAGRVATVIGGVRVIARLRRCNCPADYRANCQAGKTSSDTITAAMAAVIAPTVSTETAATAVKVSTASMPETNQRRVLRYSADTRVHTDLRRGATALDQSSARQYYSAQQKLPHS